MSTNLNQRGGRSVKPFTYLKPKNLEEACAMLSQHKDEAKMIAGGQSLMALLKLRLISSDHLIDLKSLHELEYIENSGNSVRIGALTTHRTLETSPLIKEKLPVIAEAEKRLAQVQIRNWGTVGGALCHADPVGDLGPVVTALDAKVRAVSSRGKRELSIDEFFVDIFTTSLEPDEILYEVEIPCLPPFSAGAYRKETVTAGDYAIASVAAVVALEEDGKRMKQARLVLGAVGNRPIRARKAEEALTGAEVSEEVIERAAATASEEADPLEDVQGSIEYKRRLVKILAKEMLGRAIERARQHR